MTTLVRQKQNVPTSHPEAQARHGGGLATQLPCLQCVPVWADYKRACVDRDGAGVEVAAAEVYRAVEIYRAGELGANGAAGVGARVHVKGQGCGVGKL